MRSIENVEMKISDNENLHYKKSRFCEVQKKLIQLSLNDIQNGELISNKEIIKSDLEWINTL